MLQLAKIKKDEVLYELGCGDGRIILEAAQKFGAMSVGVEMDKERFEGCMKKIHEADLFYYILFLTDIF